MSDVPYIRYNPYGLHTTISVRSYKEYRLQSLLDSGITEISGWLSVSETLSSSKINRIPPLLFQTQIMKVSIRNPQDLENLLICDPMTFDNVESDITNRVMQLICQSLFLTRFIEPGYIDFHQWRILDRCVRRQGRSLVWLNRPFGGLSLRVSRPFFGKLRFNWSRHDDERYL